MQSGKFLKNSPPVSPAAIRIAAFLVFVLAGCSSGVDNDPPVGGGQEDETLLTVYNTSDLRIELFVDGARQGFVEPDSFEEIAVDPGTHTLYGLSEDEQYIWRESNGDPFRFTVDEGETYIITFDPPAVETGDSILE